MIIVIATPVVVVVMKINTTGGCNYGDSKASNIKKDKEKTTIT